jgi:hypothetical protein
MWCLVAACALHNNSKKRRKYFSRHIAVPKETRNFETVRIYYKTGLQFLSIRYFNFVLHLSGEEVIYYAQRYTSIQIAKGLNYVEGAQLCYYKHQL